MVEFSCIDTKIDSTALADKIERLAKSATPDINQNDLFGAQYDTIRQILSGIQRQAIESFRARPKPNTPSLPEESYPAIKRNRNRRPHREHNVFLLEGGRGTGKTSLLLLLRECLLAQFLAKPEISNWENRESYNASTLVQSCVNEFDTNAAGNHRTAIPIRVPLPDGPGPHDTVMEALFARIQFDLEDRISIAEQKNEDPTELRAVLKELKDEVIFGWVFAKKEGQEALVRDSIDYREYAELRANFNVQSVFRYEAWYGFVERYLSAINAEILVPLFDDIDLDPTSAFDVIDQIKNFLAHPQIATICAFDLTRMHNDLMLHLIKRSMSVDAATYIPTHTDIYEWSNPDFYDGETASEQALPTLAQRFYSDQEILVNNMIQKAFPAWNRYHVTLDGRSTLNSLFSQYNGWFPNICVQQFLAHQREADLSDKSAHETIAWWFLNANYTDLVAHNLRSFIYFLNTLLKVTDHRDPRKAHHAEDILPRITHKPIPEIIREDPQNNFSLASFNGWGTELSHILADSGLNPYGWSGKQRGDPSERVSKFTSRHIDFVIDVMIGRHKLNTRKISGLSAWISSPIDFQSITVFKVGKNDYKPSQLGINGYFPNQILPRSCLYLYQLRCLIPLMRSIPDNAPFFAKWYATLILSEVVVANPDRGQFERFFATISEIKEFPEASELCQNLILTSERDTLDIASEKALAVFIRLIELIRGDGSKIIEKLHTAHRGLSVSPDSGESLTDVVFDLTGYDPKEDLQRYRALYMNDDYLGCKFHSSMWLLALNNANLGSNYREIGSGDIISPIDIPFDGAKSNRFPDVARESRDRMINRSPRTALLLAWSICPSISTILETGFGPEESFEDSIRAWRDLLEGFENALLSYSDPLAAPYVQKLIASNDAHPSHVEPIIYAIAHSEVAAHDKNVEDVKLEQHNRANELINKWMFPDFSRDDLEKVVEEVKEGANQISAGIKELEKILDSLQKDKKAERQCRDVAIIARISDVHAFHLIKKFNA